MIFKIVNIIKYGQFITPYSLAKNNIRITMSSLVICFYESLSPLYFILKFMENKPKTRSQDDGHCYGKVQDSVFHILKVFIMQTSPCNEYPLTPYFYFVKLGFIGVYISFLFLL